MIWASSAVRASWRRRLSILLVLSAMCALPAKAEPPPGNNADGERQGVASPTVEALLNTARAEARGLDFDGAFSTLDRALELSRGQHQERLEAEILLALGLTHRQAGAPALALPKIQDALSIFARLDAPEDRARVLCELARTYNAVGRRDLASQQLDLAETLFRQLGQTAGAGRVDSLRSLVATHDQRWADALRHGRRAVANDGTPPGDRLRALASIAYSLHQQNELPEALEAYDHLIALAWQRKDQGQLGFALCNRAQVEWRLGHSQPALEDLWQTVRRFEQGRASIRGTAAQRSEFLGRQVAAYDRLIRYLVDTSQTRQAFEVAERFHGRSLIEMLDQRAQGGLAERHPQSAQRRQDLLDALGQARLALEEVGDGLGDAPTDDPTLRRQITALEGELLALDGQLLWQNRDPRHQPEPSYPSLPSIQEALGAGEALVAYWVSEQRILAWTMLDGSFRLTQIPIPKVELAKALDAYLAPLRSHRLAEDLALTDGEAKHLATGRQLFDWLIGGLPADVLAARRLVLIPDDLLHYLPFEALVARCPEAEPATPEVVHGKYAECEYLGLQKPLAYGPSAGAFLALRRRHRARLANPLKRRQSLLAMAPSDSASSDPASTDLAPSAEASPDHLAMASPATADELRLRRGLRSRPPLRLARQEVEGVAALFADATTWIDAEASEGRLKQGARRFRVVHLATHGLVSDSLPMSSGLLLAAGPGEDGLLQAHEVLGLDLQADLVTLSACRSGRGRLQRGEGIEGLSRAFLSAGASAVLVSLWDIDDRSTPLFMEAFYRHLTAGIPAPESLVKARRGLFAQRGEVRLVLRRRPMAYAHPRFWASFVLSGGF